MQSMTTDPG